MGPLRGQRKRKRAEKISNSYDGRGSCSEMRKSNRAAVVEEEVLRWLRRRVWARPFSSFLHASAQLFCINKTVSRITQTQTDRQRDKQTGRQTDRQTDKQTNRQTQPLARLTSVSNLLSGFNDILDNLWRMQDDVPNIYSMAHGLLLVSQLNL